jgi:hypothetical protein
MTPEGYQVITKALEGIDIHKRYRVAPVPEEGEDVELVSVYREEFGDIIPAVVLYGLAKASLNHIRPTNVVFPKLEPVAYLPNSITFKDLNQTD